MLYTEVYDKGYSQGKSEGYQLAVKRLEEDLKVKARQETDKVKRAVFEELQQVPPENVYYQVKYIRSVVAAFYMNDVDGDGTVSLRELLNAYKPKSEEDYMELKGLFESSDITGDTKLGLAEFLVLFFFASDRKNGYSAAKKID
ncbi:hypothetical protein BDV33DRAFT_168867 [Aspergillus novoparasiticus]|uniref:EF-hand domain-containing protein n=1 Tax=Aspergillus novoparasiticus TaxID=986946 RepID=A0A5N6EXQ6_9EURO|nr:hypothetical protein BDV33DRAFT_168867 [Aspergillus novoparasiticus]